MASNEICRLCFKSVFKENSEVIGEVHTEILEVLLIKLNFSVSESPSICTDCWKELQDIFSFKSKCMEIEDSLTPIRQRNNMKELSEITQQSIKNENGVDEILCRLCMNVATNENKLKDSKEIIKKFLPEIVLDNDSKTFLCSQCFKSLQDYFNFAEICSDWEDKLKRYIQMFGLRKKRKFRLETFLQNLDKLEKSTLQNAYVPQITENYLFSSNDNEVEIKHELMEVEDDGELEK